MAAALLEHHGMGRIEVQSAGSSPGVDVNPMAAEALAEWGIDITDRSPKLLADDDVVASDVVVTMGCGDACPVYPGKRYLDWNLTDPAGRELAVVRAIRDDIDRRVRTLLSELLD